LLGPATVSIDHIQSIGPPVVRGIRRVIEVIDERGHLDPELDDTNLSEIFTLVCARGTGVDDLVFQVDGQLPRVARMRFADVDDVERRAVAVLPVDLVEDGNLPPERRSSVAAEDEDHRFLTSERREADAAALVRRAQVEVRGGVADVELTASRHIPHRLARPPAEGPP